MSFSVEQELPEDYFQEVMDAQEKEMVKMYLDDLGKSFSIFTLLWKYNGNF